MLDANIDCKHDDYEHRTVWVTYLRKSNFLHKHPVITNTVTAEKDLKVLDGKLDMSHSVSSQPRKPNVPGAAPKEALLHVQRLPKGTAAQERVSNSKLRVKKWFQPKKGQIIVVYMHL